MKNSSRQKNSKPKTSSRQQSSKPTITAVSSLISKINKSIQLTIPQKSSMLNSHRNSKQKVDSIKIYQPQSTHTTVHHSRKMSITSARVPITSSRPIHHLNNNNHTNFIQHGVGSQHIIQKHIPSSSNHPNHPNDKKSKQHLRSNSTISKKSSKQTTKKCFKIDLSKLVQKQKQQNKIIIQDKQINRLCFDYLYVIGKGGFGKVWCVEFKKNKKLYAMKQMLKTKIIGKKSIHSVMNQRQLLCKLKHPFIVNMNYAFQDRQTLYLVMDLLTGGDLRYHMGCRKRFKQSQAKFFIASIIYGLQFLHLNNIIHRDIKPQNLVFDQKGYLRITDLGIARIVKPNNNSDTSGTPGYMAPEVMCRQDHSFPVDYYAIGIIAYELMLNKRPYNGRNRKQIRDQILSKQVQIRAEQVPPNWSLQAADFINRMIQRKPTNRLGTQGGIVQIKQHPWLKTFPWVQLMKKQIQSPFIPDSILDNNDYRDQISSSSQDQNQAENQLLLRRKSIQDLFDGYNYIAINNNINNNNNNNNNKDKQKQKILSKGNMATTTNTHYSYIDQKQSGRDKMKIKMNNFLKLK